MQADKPDITQTTPIKKLPRKVKPVGADGHRARMFARLLGTVDYGLSHRDLLEILLFYAIRVRDTRDQAVMLMNDNKNSIYNVLSADTEQLTKIDGIGENTALMLRAMGAASKRIRANSYATPLGPSYAKPDDIAKLFMEKIPKADGTETWIAAFDSAMHLKKLQKLTNRELLPKPEDMRLLLDFTSHNNVDHIALAKVSSSSLIFPSINDITLARHMMQSFYRLGRNMIEYVIINDEGYSLTSPRMTY